MGGLIAFPALLNKTAGHAVEVFMILSGFVIFYLIEKSRERYSVFIFRRFFRLFPVFVLCLIVGVLLNSTHRYILANVSWSENPWIKDQLDLANNDNKYAGQHILWHLTMLHGIVPDNILPLADSAFNGPSWSISLEWQYYLIAPLLFMISRNTFGFLFFSIAVILVPHLPSLFPSINGGQPMRSFLPTQIAWFYIGISSFFYYREVKGFTRPDSKIIKIISLFTIIYLITQTRHLYGMIVWFIFFFVVIFDSSHKRNKVSIVIRILHGSFLQYLGKVSYPIYLLHWPIIIIAIRFLLFFNPSINTVSAYYILLITVPVFTLLLAHAVHYWIEQPSINYARRACQTKKIVPMFRGF